MARVWLVDKDAWAGRFAWFIALSMASWSAVGWGLSVQEGMSVSAVACPQDTTAALIVAVA